MNFETDGVKRIQRAFLEADPSESPGPDCPPSGDIWAGVQNQLSPQRLSPLLRHLAACPVCTESWRLAEQISQGWEEEAESGDLPGQQPWTPAASAAADPAGGSASWLRWAGIAAMVVILIGAGYLWMPITPQAPGSSLRSVPETALTLRPATCSPGQCRLEWQAIEGAEYDVRLTTPAPEFETLFEVKGAQDARLEVPRERLQAIVPGTPMQLRIAAFSPAGERLASKTFTIMLQ